jgi:hypothetical protein
MAKKKINQETINNNEEQIMNDYLLTDEFVVFSQKIKDIFEAKKAKKLELKNFYEKVQNEIKALEDEAKNLEAEFEAFKSKNVE